VLPIYNIQSGCIIMIVRRNWLLCFIFKYKKKRERECESINMNSIECFNEMACIEYDLVKFPPLIKVVVACVFLFSCLLPLSEVNVKSAF